MAKRSVLREGFLVRQRMDVSSTVDTRIRDIYPGNESRSGSFFFFFFFLSVRSRIQIFCEHTRYAAAVLRFKTPDMRFNVGFNRAPSATIRILEACLPGQTGHRRPKLCTLPRFKALRRSLLPLPADYELKIFAWEPG